MSPPAAVKIELAAADGHRFDAWRSRPAGPPKGGVVVLHAVFGLTDHMGEVCARWAAAGYCAVAPALYDRLQPKRIYPYDDARSGSISYAALTEAQIFADIEAARLATEAGRAVAISGFCTGGTWAWRAAAHLPFAAQVNFYGSAIAEFIALRPGCPTIVHFGDADHVVPLDRVEAIRRAHPEIDLHVYPGAGHAFENREQPTYDEAAGDLAWDRSIAFLERHVGRTA